MSNQVQSSAKSNSHDTIDACNISTMKNNFFLALFALTLATPSYAQCTLSSYPEKSRSVNAAYFTTFKTGTLYECSQVKRRSDMGNINTYVYCSGLEFLPGSQGFYAFVDKSGVEFNLRSEFLRQERDWKQVGSDCIYSEKLHYRQTLPDEQTFLTTVHNTVTTTYIIPSY